MSHNGAMNLARTLGLGVVVTALLVPSAGARTRATLRVVDRAPLTVAGAGFRSRETVRLTVTINAQSWTKMTSASAGGTFVVAWRRLRFDPCATPAVISAHGAETGTVTAKIPTPECASP